MLRAGNGDLQSAYSDDGAFLGLGPWGSSDASAQVAYAPVDGDDAADLIEVAPTGQVQVSSSDGTSLGSPATWASIPAGARAVFADANGDGQADLIYQTSDGTVYSRASNSNAFASAQAFGSWPVGRELQAIDVNSDGRADLIGRDGDSVYVSLNQGPYDEAQPGVYQAPAGEQEDSSGSGGSLRQSAASLSPVLSWDDENLFVNSYDSTRSVYDATGARGSSSLHLTKQASAGWVRFTVLWNNFETNAEYKAAVTAGVQEAINQGLTPYVTLTGAGYDSPASNTNPSVAGFASFVIDAVNTLKPLGVTHYSLWNEPNLPNGLYLKVKCSSGRSTNGALKYRDLYQGGYAAVKTADPSARVYLGELSEQTRAGVDHCTDPAHSSTSLTATRYLAKIAEDGAIKTHGVAWHAYQHYSSPGMNSRGVGIFDTKLMKQRISALYKSVNGSRKLQTPSGNVPSLLITEFGYFNAPFPSRTSSTAWTEAQRATFYPDALEIARSNGVSVFTFWELGEAYPDLASAQAGAPAFDTGMVSVDSSSFLSAKGTRPYGVASHTGHDLNHPQARATFCAIQQWASSHGGTVDAAPCT